MIITHCLDKNNGELRWKFKTAAAVLAPPLIVDGLVCFGSYDSFFYAVDLTDQKIWSYPTNSSIHYPALKFADMIIFVGRDQILYCLDKAGKLIWRKELAEQVSGPLIRVEKLIALAQSDGKIIFVDPEQDGQTIKTLIIPESEQPLINYRYNHLMFCDAAGLFRLYKVSFP